MLLLFRDAARLIVSGTCLYAAAACDNGESGGSSDVDEVVQRDSAGITIIETLGTAARSPIEWRLDAEPDLQIGSVAGGGPDQFFFLEENIAGLRDGGIVVLNAGSGILTFFDRFGRFLRSTSGKGVGPGEFGSPFFVPYASNDSLLIYDVENIRYTLFSSDGRGHRNVTPEGYPFQQVGSIVRGASSSGVLSMRSVGQRPREDGLHLHPIDVRWTDLESGQGSILVQFDQPVFVSSRESQYPLRSVNVPFYVYPSVAVHADGFFVTGGHAGEVLAFDGDRNLVRIMRLIESPRSVTSADLEAFIAQISTYEDGISESDARRVYQRMELPDQWPTFQRVMRDPIGWVWAELFRLPSDEIKRWMIFDPDGVARGTLELPPELEVTYLGQDYVLGRWRDELGVEYVRRYRLHR